MSEQEQIVAAITEGQREADEEWRAQVRIPGQVDPTAPLHQAPDAETCPVDPHGRPCQGTDSACCSIHLTETERILADRIGDLLARAERAEAQVERVRGLVPNVALIRADHWRIEEEGGECGCSMKDCYECGPWHACTHGTLGLAAEISAALAETETGHQTPSEAPRSAEEPVSRVPGPDGVREAGRRAGAIVDSEGAW
jgi:hypothetical protein